ncbi:uncharacterized protein BBOV_I001200 [Babesia bovis T2Bo]|uniref:Membrane protein, putative n=1 Tax=Babesia bovis TaxID=5865 RepID=A7AXE0_BABBO|nr:uncharacterized protein BBOV_I001200 [Babesia bovis T2Bo]EDO05213.1 putative integral membrane protein [Babesia bovis T2Bo]|eukprot:XP_001608781.1 hypothetical protein [Babesia bovis T2Bo]
MDTNTCTTIVLVLLWLYLCCQALGSMVALMGTGSTTEVLSTTTTLSTVLLVVCLWQCKKAGYLVSPMTWYHWVLMVLLVLLQVVVLVLEQQGWELFSQLFITSTYPIYGIAVVLLGILGGTLFCGWKCNLFCRPCCKSQYICYGSAIVVVLVILVVLGLTASLAKHSGGTGFVGFGNAGQTEKTIIRRLSNIMIPITQSYAMVVIWNTLLKLPYSLPEVVAVLTSALAVGSLLTVGILRKSLGNNSVISYAVLAVHIVTLGITLYFLEYKTVFYWPKDYMCFGLLAAVVILVALVAIAIFAATSSRDTNEIFALELTLLGYSMVLMVPTLWYAYRCGLLTWKWSIPKKKGLKPTDTAENTTTETDIAKET